MLFWHASRHTLLPPALVQLLPVGHATLPAPPHGSEQYPPGTLVAQNAGSCPQSASAEHAVPTLEGPHRPVDTLQFELAQSASAVHFGRQRFERQTCSVLQPELAWQARRHSLVVLLTGTQVEPEGQAALLQSWVQ